MVSLLVIVIKHVSHRALVRPGRFDTKITVPMPDVKGRHDILKLHLKNVQVADGMFVKNVSGNGTNTYMRVIVLYSWGS